MRETTFDKATAIIHAVNDAELVIADAIRAGVADRRALPANVRAHEITQALDKAGFEVRYRPIDLVPEPQPTPVETDAARSAMATYHVRVGWPEFFSKAIRLPKGSDVATVARAAKDAAADHHGMKHRGQWPAFSWDEDRFLAPDEPAPLAFIVGPSQALIERQGSATSYILAHDAIREGKGACDVAEALGRSSPDGRQGNIWKLLEDRRATFATETEKAARWTGRLIGEILGDGWDRQAEAGVEGAAKEAVARLRRDRGRMAFEDLDRNPPSAASHADYLIATWVRSLGDAVDWCEARLMPRRLVMTASLKDWPNREQQKDLDNRLGMIRDLRGVVGVSPCLSGLNPSDGAVRFDVEVRFDFYITTVGCEYTPGDLPPRPARKAA